MDSRTKTKIYSLRHFFFYMGLAGLAGILVAIVSEALNWSHGLSFAALFVAGLIVSTMTLREDLFAPSRHTKAPRQGRRHA
jgi:VanZ family protein